MSFQGAFLGAYRQAYLPGKRLFGCVENASCRQCVCPVSLQLEVQQIKFPANTSAVTGHSFLLVSQGVSTKGN